MRHFLKDKIPSIALLGIVLIALALFDVFSNEALLDSRQDFDRRGLSQLFAQGSFDNDLVVDTYLLSAGSEIEALSNLHLLNLDRDRLAYIARRGTEATTADDGFNGKIDLLVAVDMYGRISAARVIEKIDSDRLYGVVDIIDSKWMNEFSGNSMRDILRLSWQPITAENEIDQFVGASITPKSVANQIYDALVFYQSN